MNPAVAVTVHIFMAGAIGALAGLAVLAVARIRRDRSRAAAIYRARHQAPPQTPHPDYQRRGQ